MSFTSFPMKREPKTFTKINHAIQYTKDSCGGIIRDDKSGLYIYEITGCVVYLFEFFTKDRRQHDIHLCKWKQISS